MCVITGCELCGVGNRRKDEEASNDCDVVVAN